MSELADQPPAKDVSDVGSYAEHGHSHRRLIKPFRKFFASDSKYPGVQRDFLMPVALCRRRFELE